jgi:predicted HTH domain antitoxin
MAATVTIEIPADVLESARMTVEEARLELAIALFSRGRLSMGKAAELAGMPVGRFQSQLGAREIGPHYSIENALEDSAALAACRRR